MKERRPGSAVRSVKRGKSGGGERNLKVRVKTAAKRKLASTLWLQRQLNDPYVAKARADGYRSRAAYKLVEIDDKHRLLAPGRKVLDLGAAPGGWTQVAVARAGAGNVVGVDYLEMEAIPGSVLLEKDFLDEDAPDMIREALGGPVDVVLSDMAAPTTGHRSTDHIRIVDLCRTAADFAGGVLNPGGSFVAKVLRGGTEGELLAELKRDYRAVRHVKPEASRAGSAESYVVATGFRGRSGAPSGEAAD